MLSNEMLKELSELLEISEEKLDDLIEDGQIHTEDNVEDMFAWINEDFEVSMFKEIIRKQITPSMVGNSIAYHYISEEHRCRILSNGQVAFIYE